METIEEMKAAILKAVKEGMQKNRIDAKGKGTAANRLIAGKTVTDAKIREMYVAVSAWGHITKPEMVEKKEDKSDPETITAAIIEKPVTISVTSITRKEDKTMETLVRENEDLKARVSNLEKVVDELKQTITSSVISITDTEKPITSPITAITEKHQGKNILGFSLAFNSKDSKWYAARRLDKKQYSLYIGKLENAESKIRAYCSKKGIEMKSLEKS